MSDYGYLTVVNNLGLRQTKFGRKTTVEALCRCGKKIEVALTRLKGGHVKSCGCAAELWRQEFSKMGKANAVVVPVGTRFGRLTVLEDLGEHQIRCRCDCGVTCVKDSIGLRTGRIKSCDCLHRDNAKQLGLNQKRLPASRELLTRWYAYQSGALKRGLSFNLSMDQFFELTTCNCCHYCGASPLELPVSVVMGIDRIENSKGYDPDNSVPCCTVCNRAKSGLSHSDFDAWVERISGDKPYRPQGWVAIEKIVDSFGKEISIEKAHKYGWLKTAYANPQPEAFVEGSPNLFVDNGRQLIAYCFGFRAPIQNFVCQNFGVGTGVTTARVTDVALEAPITLTTGLTKPIDAVDFLSAFVVRVAFTLGLGDANGYVISEMGLFSGNNSLMARKIRAVSINKNSEFSPTLSWRLRF